MPLPVRRLVCLLVAAGLTGCSAKGPAEPLWVGHVAPFTGPRKAAGEHAKQALLLAVGELNDKPDNWIGGRKVAVVHADSRGDLDLVQAEAVRLVTVNRVVALLGGSSAAEVDRLGRAVQSYGLVLVTGGTLPAAAPAGAIFSVGVAPAQAGQALARFAAGELKASRVVALSDSRDATAMALAAGFVKEFPHEKDARADEWSYKSEGELAELAERLKKANPQAVLLAGTAADLGRLRARLGDKSSVPLLFGGDAENLAALQADREAGEGVYLATPYVADAGVPQGQEFAKKYQERFHELPDLYAGLAYDSARLLFEGMRRAKSTPAGKAREELPKIDHFASLTGPLAVNPDDHYARRPVFVVRLQDRQAKLVKRYDPDKPAEGR